VVDAGKVKALERILLDLGSGLMAVSGGLDSRTLFEFARQCGADLTPMFFRGPHMTPGENAAALAWLSDRHPAPLIIDVDVLQAPEVRANTRERCYHCKKALFTAAADQALALGLFHILDGTNATDHSEFRPGIKALEELGVRSPFAEAGLTKPEVAGLAAQLGMDRPEQPSRACLLTRFAYGQEPDRDLLQVIGRIEDALMELGLSDFRLRAPGPDELLLQVASYEQEMFVTLQDAVNTVLKRETNKPVQVEFPDRVSGFYDRSR
jgi:uncharacterized protein